MSELGNKAHAFLAAAGFSERSIEQLHSGTRLLHDLHLSGDSLTDVISVLERKFGVDLSGFDADAYTPREFSLDNYLFSFFSNSQIAKKKMGNYREITLDMVENVLLNRRWPKS